MSYSPIRPKGHVFLRASTVQHAATSQTGARAETWHRDGERAKVRLAWGRDGQAAMTQQPGQRSGLWATSGASLSWWSSTEYTEHISYLSRGTRSLWEKGSIHLAIYPFGGGGGWSPNTSGSPLRKPARQPVSLCLSEGGQERGKIGDIRQEEGSPALLSNSSRFVPPTGGAAVSPIPDQGNGGAVSRMRKRCTERRKVTSIK